MRALALSLLLGVTLAAPAAMAGPKDLPLAKAGIEGRGGDPELASLRRQLASAVLLAELKLSAEQKTALSKIIAEAKHVRAEAKDDAALATIRAERKAALRKAIDEVHAKGTLSEATRASLKDGAHEAFDDMGELREKIRELHVSMKNVLTAEQLERLHELRKVEAGKMKKEGSFKKGGKFKGKGGKGLMRLIMSDEFAAELER